MWRVPQFINTMRFLLSMCSLVCGAIIAVSAASIDPEIKIESRLVNSQGKPVSGKVNLAVQLGNWNSSPNQIYYQKDFINYEILASANGKISLKCNLQNNDYSGDGKLAYSDLIAQFPLSARIILTLNGQTSVFPTTQLGAAPFALRAAQADSVKASAITGIIPAANLPASGSLGAGSISNALIANNAVESDQIKNGAVSGLKIESGVFASGLTRSPTTGQVSVDTDTISTKTYADGKVINDTNTANWNSTSSAPSQASVKNVVDNINSSISSTSSSSLPKSGGIMSGHINMGTNKVTSLGDPTAAQDAATKNYVDNRLSTQTLTGFDATNNSGTVAISDTELTAFGKLQNSLNSIGTSITSLNTSSHSALSIGASANGLSVTNQVLSLGLADAVNGGAMSSSEFTLLANATNNNTVSSLVRRDSSGNFTAGTITAALSGNATTATTATNFSGSLTGDVTGTQGATVVSAVGGVSAANVATAATSANAGTDANTASTLVKRDASGNFSAGTITASFTGNVTGNLAGNATTATTASAVSDNAITSAKINDGAIVNIDINSSAAIDGTKISPNFGNQNIVTTGTGSLTVAGNTTLSGNLAVAGTTSLGSLGVGNTNVTGTLGVTGATSLGGVLSVGTSDTDSTLNSQIKKIADPTASQDASTKAYVDAGDSNSSKLNNVGFSASVSSNALTVALKQANGSDCSSTAPCKLSFRSSTSTSGQYSIVSVTSALSLEISSGSTLGTVASLNSYLFIYALNNSGTVELAISGDQTFDEGRLQTTSAEGGAGAADSSATLYSSTARSNVAVRLIARIKIAEATAGTWATAPTEVSIAPFRESLGNRWIPFTMNITGTSTDPTKGTVLIDKAVYRVVDDMLYIMYNYAQSSAGSGGSGTYKFALPSGFTINNNVVPYFTETSTIHKAVLGSGWGNNGTSASETIIPAAYDSTHLYLIRMVAAGTPTGVGSTSFTFANTTQQYSFMAMIPINL